MDNTISTLNEAWLITGGNVGDRSYYLSEARYRIGRRCGNVIQASAVFETAAWGLTTQASFYNQCLVIRTQMNGHQLLKELLDIEASLERIRRERYGPRTIDIDILFFNDETIDEPGLHVPHPHIPDRRFVLECLNDLDPNKIHPLRNQTIAQLLSACTDPLAVYKIP
jgi:2-amino-4-hydroxy-6-hydroxymethyldihydropteridine diphosphokinase